MSAVKSLALALLVLCAAAPWASAGEGPRGTGDLGIVIERASGSVAIVEWSDRRILGRVEGLGDLSHASAVYSRDQRYAYIFGRDGGLTKLDLLEQKFAARVIQGGNSIGGAISDDGTLIAVSNYEPGGVKVFDAETSISLPTFRPPMATRAPAPRPSASSMRRAAASSIRSMTPARSGSPISRKEQSRRSPALPISAASHMTP
jgi:hypothetical protein